MRIDKKYIIDWLIPNLSDFASLVYKAAIYGSVNNGSMKPNDCDLLIVSSESINSANWNILRNKINKLKEIFYAEFKLPLSICLLTTNEVTEFNDFFTDSTEIRLTSGSTRSVAENAPPCYPSRYTEI